MGVGSAVRRLLRRPGPPQGARSYSQDPAEAERLAGTIAGHRAERERIQHAGGDRAGRAGRPATFRERAKRRWSETPIRWAPIPVVLGALVLVGIQAHRQWQRNERIIAEPYIDATGHPVRTKGPWSVRQMANPVLRDWRASVEHDLTHMGLGEQPDPACVVPSVWIPAVLVGVRLQLGRNARSRPDALRESRPVLCAGAAPRRTPAGGLAAGRSLYSRRFRLPMAPSCTLGVLRATAWNR